MSELPIEDRQRRPDVIARRGLMLVLSSPSGAGKSTIARALLAQDAELSMSVSVTTRPARPGEQDGRDYLFIDRASFEAMIAEGALLEYATVFGNSYGSPRGPVEEALAAGRDVIFDVDWEGTQQLRQNDRCCSTLAWSSPDSHPPSQSPRS